MARPQLGSVRRAADGSWVADVTINGVRRTGKARTKAEANARRREILEQLLNQEASPIQRGGFSLRQARALSLQIRWAGKAYERTAAIYSQAAVDHFGASFPVDEITAQLVDRWRQQLLAQGNRPATVNAKTSALRSMLQDACLHGHLAAVPTMPRQIKLSNTKDRVLSDRERDLICQALVARGEPAAADLLVFMLETACRWGEAERLKGQDVDLAKARVSFWQTKAGRPRSVPLTRRAVDALAPHLPAVKGHRVWPYPYWQFKRLFEGAKESAGIDDPALTIHSTRHTCASKLAARGIPLHQLMAFGGWTSLASVQRYLHLHTDALAGCVAALED
ncbi:MAG: site-specific integrase [Synechococcaceae cyanobacterium]|nr:site-specific integrase [Synechococcaceae cyanobacterium]